MWHGDTLYFLSDRGANQRANIWARGKNGAVRQVTQFADFDVTFPAIGPEEIVFEAGGRLYLLNLATEKSSEVAIQVVTDRTTLKPRTESVAELIREAAPSPTGKRAVFGARGEVFTVPAEFGPVLNLTRTSGSAGAIALVARRQDARLLDGSLRRVRAGVAARRTARARGRRGRPSDRASAIRCSGRGQRPLGPSSIRPRRCACSTSPAAKLRRDRSGAGLEWRTRSARTCRLRWSADSRWLTWARPIKETANRRVPRRTRPRQKHQVTPGYFADLSPVFDPDGKYLYSSRTGLRAGLRRFRQQRTYPNSTRIVAMALRKDVASAARRPQRRRGGREGQGQRQGSSERPRTATRTRPRTRARGRGQRRRQTAIE